jgi:hypothetical protein
MIRRAGVMAQRTRRDRQRARAAPLIRGAGTMALLMAAWCAPCVAQAGDSTVADDFFRAGSAAYVRRDYRAAAAAFDAADREAPHAAAKYNAARAWELAVEPARAADALQRALEAPSGLTSDQSSDARRRLARLRRALALVEVQAPPGTRISVAHIDGAVAPITFHLPPGQHRVVGEGAHGAKRSKEIEARAGASLTIRWPAADANVAAPVSVTAGSSTAAGVGASSSAGDGAAEGGIVEGAAIAAPPDADGAATSGGTSGMAIGGYVAIGVAVVATGFTIGLGVSALGAHDEWEASRRPEDEHVRDRAESLRTATNVALTTALVSAAAGATLLFLAPSSSDPPANSVAISSSVAGAPAARRPRSAPARAWLSVGPAGASLRGKF